MPSESGAKATALQTLARSIRRLWPREAFGVRSLQRRFPRQNTLSDFAARGFVIGEMQNMSDAQLLRDYAAHGSEPAFGEIAARHTDLIYSAALRQCGSPEPAREIAQSVFINLARHARKLAGQLPPDASLAGWLYRGTRYAALNSLRDERRRQEHERLVMENFNPSSEASPDWERVAPVLDEAMAELNDADREAVLLRFFQNQDFHAVGLALGVSDDAAQKRVSRAVERLREFLAKRGVTVGASGLVVVISTNAVQIAPIGLVAMLTSASLAGAAAGTGTALTLLKLIGLSKLQLGIFSALVVAVGTIVVVRQNTATVAAPEQTLGSSNGLSSTALSNGRSASPFTTIKRAPASLEPEPIYLGKTLSEWIADLRSGNPKLKQDAWDALIAIGPPAIPALKEALEDIRTVNSVAFILAQIGKEALPILLESLTNGPLLTRQEIAGTGVMQNPALLPYEEEIVPALVDCMRHEDAMVRGGAVNALQSYFKRPDLVLAPLMDCLTDTNANVRGSAVTVIRQFRSGAAPAISNLVWLARQDADSHVRTRAAESLRVISPERADQEGL